MPNRVRAESSVNSLQPPAMALLWRASHSWRRGPDLSLAGADLAFRPGQTWRRATRASPYGMAWSQSCERSSSGRIPMHRRRQRKGPDVPNPKLPLIDSARPVQDFRAAVHRSQWIEDSVSAPSQTECAKAPAYKCSPDLFPPILAPDLTLSARRPLFRWNSAVIFEPRIYLRQIFWRANRKRPP